jgi:hypothetical protein
MAPQLARQGFTSTRVYADGTAPERDRAALLAAFDAGHALVHFYGHGGRTVWRTGPPDPGRNRELFGLSDLDDLAPTPHLSTVVAMSCYSAPFDHPTEDSIGERFLRLPDRGAIAVIAAGWRNAPTPLVTRLVVEQLARPGTVGEALLHAKREPTGEAFRAQYNLLGDPATPLAIPELPVSVAWIERGRRIRARVEDEAFAGRGLVEWVDAVGGTLQTVEVDVVDGALDVPFPDGAARSAAGAVVYVWDATTGTDGMGAVFWAGEAQP